MDTLDELRHRRDSLAQTQAQVLCDPELVGLVERIAARRGRLARNRDKLAAARSALEASGAELAEVRARLVELRAQAAQLGERVGEQRAEMRELRRVGATEREALAKDLEARDAMAVELRSAGVSAQAVAGALGTSRATAYRRRSTTAH